LSSRLGKKGSAAAELQIVARSGSVPEQLLPHLKFACSVP